MSTINLRDAKTQLFELVNAVIHGDEIAITIAGKPVVKLVRINKKRPRKFGVLKGKTKIADDFDAPLPENILIEFGI